MLPTRAMFPNQFTMVRHGDSNEPQVTLTLNRTDLILVQKALAGETVVATGDDEERLATLIEGVDELAFSAYQLGPDGQEHPLAEALR